MKITKHIPFRLRSAALALLGRNVAIYDIAEEGVLIIATRNVTKEDTVVEVGSRYGSSSHFLSLISKHVYAFEPNRKCRYQLTKLSENYKNITALFYAIGDKEGKFGFAEQGPGSHIEENGKGTEIVEMRRLDSWNFPKPAVLFMDCEGYELRVLKGANLDNFRMVASEIHRMNGGDTYGEVSDYLKSKSFITERVDAVNEVWIVGTKKSE
jgi:FkbM family methyltransferase